MKKLIVIAVFVALLEACASTPQRNEQVEAARAELDKLSQDPLAQQAANNDMEAARNSLQQAELALQQRKRPEEVDDLAYLALRHAQAGEARVAEAHARQEVAQAEQERNRIVLQTRERETQQARGQAEIAKSELANAQQELRDLQAKQTDRGMIVTLSDVLFDTAQATLKPGADRDLDRLADVLKANPKTRVMVEGHTDSVGSDEYNQELSERRAQAVTSALSARGVPADQYQTRGLGKGFPVASNDTAAGRQQNRRVEIVFSDETGRFASGAASPQ